MQIFFSPELVTPECQVLNIVDLKDKAVGYVAFLFDEKKMYVYGHCEEEGVSEDYKDLVTHFIQGMSKAKSDLDVFSYLSVAGKKIDIKLEKPKN
ncbi:hypothetical protein IM538_15060 [Cytobacillus suaedae]|nr:hypothetical protein IM538_15060 [Cytobacillus suaedae]